MTAPIAAPELFLLLRAADQTRIAAPPSEGMGALASLAEASFQEVVAEAILGRSAGGTEEAPPVSEAGEPPCPPDLASPPADPGHSSGAARASAVVVPPHETEVILREAQRAGVDPSLLVALRRVENGGPGREFGVLSVSAPGLEAQTRVAANTIQRSMARFERQGGEAVDQGTGRYTEGFVRFLSARYAPSGASNDPMGLNRFHAENLLALYRKASEGGRRG